MNIYENSIYCILFIFVNLFSDWKIVDSCVVLCWEFCIVVFVKDVIMDVMSIYF